MNRPAARLGLLLGLVVACRQEDPPADRLPGETADPSVSGLGVSIDPIVGIRPLVARLEESALDGVTWAWTVDGEPAEVEGSVVPASLLWPGQQWEVTASAAGRVGSANVEVPFPVGGNVLVLLIDDLGADHFHAAALADTPVLTPNMDALANSGIYFENAYASPVCSATRSAILTGRHARRTGIGTLVVPSDDHELSPEAITLPEALTGSHAGTYTSFGAGKYHLASPSAPSGLAAPLLQGFSWYAGSVDNLPDEPGGYYAWLKNDNGVLLQASTYATTDTANDAVAQLAATPSPWFAYIAFNAAHGPFHAPPAELTTVDVAVDAPAPVLFDAMLESVDTEIGRILASIPPAVLAETTIVLLGDNGSPSNVVVAPFDPDRAKRSVFEGGVHIPLVISGAAVPGPGRSSALVHVVDLLPTLADVAGVPLETTPDGLALPLPAGGVRALDGISLVPWLTDPGLADPRTYVFAEAFAPNGPPPYTKTDERMIRDKRWKLIVNDLVYQGYTETLFFDTTLGTVDEGPELLAKGPLDSEQQEAFDRLAAALDAQLAAAAWEGF